MIAKNPKNSNSNEDLVNLNTAKHYIPINAYCCICKEEDVTNADGTCIHCGDYGSAAWD